MTRAYATSALPLVLVGCRNRACESGEVVTGQRWSDGMLITEPCRMCDGAGHVLVDDPDSGDEILDNDALRRWEAA